MLMAGSPCLCSRKMPITNSPTPPAKPQERKQSTAASTGPGGPADAKSSVELPVLVDPVVPGQTPVGMRLRQATYNYVHYLRSEDSSLDWAEVPARRRRRAKRATALVEIWR